MARVNTELLGKFRLPSNSDSFKKNPKNITRPHYRGMASFKVAAQRRDVRKDVTSDLGSPFSPATSKYLIPNLSPRAEEIQSRLSSSIDKRRHWTTPTRGGGAEIVPPPTDDLNSTRQG